MNLFNHLIVRIMHFAKFFDRKGRDLSSNSNDGYGPKMIPESETLNNSNIGDKLFAEGLNSPESVGILLNCLMNLKNQLSNVFEIINTTKESKVLINL